MTTLIPAISTCVSRRFSGARRTAERLAQKHAVNRLPGNDDAQRANHRTKKRTLNSKGVGIQAQERTPSSRSTSATRGRYFKCPPHTAHRQEHAWAEMAILSRRHSEMNMCAEFLRKRKLPHQLR